MAEEKQQSRFEAAAATESTSLVKDWMAYLKQNKKWWLLPILGAMLLLSVLLLLSSTVAAPFIYTLF